MFKFLAFIKGKTAAVFLDENTKFASPFHKNCYAALKVLTNFDPEGVDQFTRELDALITIGPHPNVIALLGWTFYHEMPALITELATSNLAQYVQSFRGETIPNKAIISILWQITQALDFVASRQLVHRDVACRNILLTEYLIAKLGDFGLCCRCDDTLLYEGSAQNRMPIKWLSIEAINDRIFSEKSDIWAFGILVYETFSFGSVPYATLTNQEMLEFLQAGNRLEQPPGTPDEIYEIMLSCWREQPSDRPNFATIADLLRQKLELETAGYGYLILDEVASPVERPLKGIIDNISIPHADVFLKAMNARKLKNT